MQLESLTFRSENNYTAFHAFALKKYMKFSWIRSESSSTKTALEDALKFLEILTSWFFHSPFRINVERFVRSFKVGKVKEHTGVTPNMFLQHSRIQSFLTYFSTKKEYDWLIALKMIRRHETNFVFTYL